MTSDELRYIQLSGISDSYAVERLPWSELRPRTRVFHGAPPDGIPFMAEPHRVPPEQAGWDRMVCAGEARWFAEHPEREFYARPTQFHEADDDELAHLPGLLLLSIVRRLAPGVVVLLHGYGFESGTAMPDTDETLHTLWMRHPGRPPERALLRLLTVQGRRRGEDLADTDEALRAVDKA